jgi:putative ABC transport system permease protein
MNVLRRFCRLCTLRRHDAELAEELEHHRAMRQADFEAQGLAPSDAALASRRAMGNVTLARDDAREVWAARWADRLWRDARYTVRGLRRDRGFTLTATVILALGITATTAVFSIADAELWKPLPFPEPEQLVSVVVRGPGDGAPTVGVAGADLEEWRAGAASAFSDLAVERGMSPRVLQLRSAESVLVTEVTSNYFRTLRRDAIAGRVFAADDARGVRSAIITDRAVARLFSGNASIVGLTLMLEGAPAVVVGVVPADDALGRSPDLFVPIDEYSAAFRDRSQPIAFSLIGRLRPGVGADRAARVLQAAVDRTTQASGGAGNRVEVEDLRNAFSGYSWRQLYFFMAASVIVLLLCAVNVAALLVSRAMRRGREFALRRALGGGVGALMHQLLVEGLVLAALGCVTGLLLASWVVGLLTPALPGDFLGRSSAIAVDLRAGVFSMAAAALATLLFALVPLPLARRGTGTSTLRDGGRAGQSRGEGRARSILLTFQIALTLVLVAGAGIFLKSFVALTRVPLGFEPSNVVAFRVALTGPRYDTDDSRRAYVERLEQRVRALPGVRMAAIATSSPLGSGPSVFIGRPDHPAPAPGDQGRALFRSIGPEYFRTLGIRMQRGREFSSVDVPGAPRTAIINTTVATRLFAPGEDPIGTVIDLLPGNRAAWTNRPGTLQIVGVVADAKEVGVNEVAFGGVYVPYAQLAAPRIEFLVRTDVPPATVLPALRAAAAEADPSIPVTSVTTLAERVDLVLKGDRFNVLLVSTFAGIGLLLATIGIYATTAYNIQARTREFGVKLALGARPGSLIGSAMWRTGRLALTSALLGLAAMLALARLLDDALYLVPGSHEGILYGVTTTDPTMLGAAFVGVLTTALAAAAVPTRQVMRIDPVEALRNE